uniref:Transmembrane protein n=1 Tax=Meloidogyne incognita TaxID=6306 RepID=A0A914LMX4_MELIC
MWFYFSGSGLEQQTGSGPRRESRSGSGAGLEKGGEASGAEQRKSTGHAQMAPRRESRSKESISGTAAPKPRKSVASTSAALNSSTVRHSTTGGHRSSNFSSDLMFQSSSTSLLSNVLRALTVRILLMSHSILCIWAAAELRADNSIWAFSLIAFCLIGEGFYAVIVRAGDEPRLFSFAVSIYLSATIPPIWIMLSSLCDYTLNSPSINLPNNYSSPLVSLGLQPNFLPNEGIILPQILTYTLFLVLIMARWMLPRFELNREELSQILLAYMAITTDILEFAGLLNRSTVCSDSSLKMSILSAFALSLIQFAFILTASRSRKMRIAVATKILLSTNRHDFRQAFFDLDIWSFLISLACQDLPFLIVRLIVLGWLWEADFALILFISKNILIILLEIYRIYVLINDRYRNPEVSARSLLDEKRQSMAIPQQAGNTRTSRAAKESQ